MSLCCQPPQAICRPPPTLPSAQLQLGQPIHHRPCCLPASPASRCPLSTLDLRLLTLDIRFLPIRWSAAFLHALVHISGFVGFSATTPLPPPTQLRAPYTPPYLSVHLDWIVVPRFQSLGSFESPNIYALCSGSLSLVPSRSRYVDFLPSHPPGSASVNRFQTCLPYPAPVIRSRDQPSPHLSRGDRARSEHSGSDCHPAAAPVQRHPGCSLTRVQQLKRA